MAVSAGRTRSQSLNAPFVRAAVRQTSASSSSNIRMREQKYDWYLNVNPRRQHGLTDSRVCRGRRATVTSTFDQ